MILTVTPNPALDLTWHADRLQPGRSHRVAAGATRAGGKGLNVARVLVAVGSDVRALTTAGGAPGDELTADLERSGIRSELVPVSRPTRRSIAIVDGHSGEATVLNEHGAPLTPDEAAALVSAAERLADTAQAVAISGSLPPGFGPEMVGALVRRLVERGIPVVADVAGHALVAAARAGATAVKPNLDELIDATGESDPIAAARRLQVLGAGIVAASLGPDGLIVLGPDGRGVRARLGRALRGNATGAGDAAVAAIAAALAHARGADATAASATAALDLDAVARRAAAWSASAVLMPLAGDVHPDRDALEREISIDPLENP